MKPGDFVIKVEFPSDEGTVSLGADGVIYVEPNEGSTSVELTTEKMALIKLLQEAEAKALGV